MKTILFYGAFCDKKHKLTTGLTVVSSIVIEQMEMHYILKKINIADRIVTQRGSFFFVFFRSVQFFLIFLRLLFLLIFNKVDAVYYQPVYSKMGIVRDSIALRIIALFRKPIIGHALGMSNIKQYVKSHTLIGKFCLWNINKMMIIIVEGEKMRKQFDFLTNYENKVIVIPNGLKEEYVFDKKAKSYRNGETFKLLYLSNLIFSKGYFDVLKAMDILINKKNVNVECKFAGRFYQTFEAEDNDKEFEGENSFKTYIEKHSLTDKIKYVQGLYGEEKKDAFLEANAFILPTYYSAEGQPMSILEAMSYGCVPIVTNHGHISSMINETNGCFVKPKSPESIANSVIDLLDNPDVYTEKSQNSIRDFKKKFRGDVFSSKIIKVIDICLTN